MESSSGKLTDSQKKTAVALVHHLETMLSYQQLAMEIYNDAASFSTMEKIPWGSELGRYEFTAHDSDTLRVAECLIPALEKKLEILHLMEIKHRQAIDLVTIELQQTYQDMTLLISALLERANFMYYGFKQWVNYEIMNFNAMSLDENERVAMARAITSLNELIYIKIGLTYDDFLDILFCSINSVRVFVKLTPLTKDVFRKRNSSALTGAIVRYFSD
jgi:hypothetical protein